MDEAKDAGATRDLYQGFGDVLARAIEIVAVPFVFGFLGWLVDRWTGLSPVFMIVMGAFGAVGTLVSAYYRYRERMAQHDAAGVWRRAAG